MKADMGFTVANVCSKQAYPRQTHDISKLRWASWQTQPEADDVNKW